MSDTPRVVVDTNALVSRLLVPDSTPARAVRRAVNQAELLVSSATLDELVDVLTRPKFDRYLTTAERQRFVRLIGRIATLVQVVHSTHACRDPRDDKFLDLALSGSARVIITGGQDMLALHPFRGISIVSPAAYVNDPVSSCEPPT